MSQHPQQDPASGPGAETSRSAGPPLLLLVVLIGVILALAVGGYLLYTRAERATGPRPAGEDLGPDAGAEAPPDAAEPLEEPGPDALVGGADELPQPPVTFDFVEFATESEAAGRQARMTITNRTEKGVGTVRLRVHYLGPDGEELSSFPWSISVYPVFLEPKAASTELLGAGVPEAATKATASLKRIDFTDGTEWRAE
jgi:hypothetical protein